MVGVAEIGAVFKALLILPSPSMRCIPTQNTMEGYTSVGNCAADLVEIDIAVLFRILRFEYISISKDRTSRLFNTSLPGMNKPSQSTRKRSFSDPNVYTEGNVRQRTTRSLMSFPRLRTRWLGKHGINIDGHTPHRQYIGVTIFQHWRISSVEIMMIHVVPLLACSKRSDKLFLIRYVLVFE